MDSLAGAVVIVARLQILIRMHIVMHMDVRVRCLVERMRMTLPARRAGHGEGKRQQAKHRSSNARTAQPATIVSQGGHLISMPENPLTIQLREGLGSES